MYRRIEMITTFPKHDPINGGIMLSMEPDVVDAWIYKLRGAQRNLQQNSRFYFTEKGWAEVGRAVIKACIKTGQKYRVLSVKENSVNVVWEDKHTHYEIAAQHKKQRN